MEGDYTSSVYAWFDKCGIIGNIRTLIRQNLVNALKSKDLSLNQMSNEPKSAKQYVYDLLIAEYLWNHNYLYTLSVFASEAPMLVNFRKNISKLNDDTDGNESYKLKVDYINHTLETLGIQPNNPCGQDIISQYSDSNMPLLLIILQSIISYCVEIHPELKTNQQYIVKKATQHNECQTDFISDDLSAEKYKIIAARKKLIRQKEIYNSQLEEKEKELKERVNLIEQQMMQVNEKLAQAQGIINAVNMKERELIEIKKQDEREIHRRKLELTAKENLISRETERLEKDRDTHQIFETNLKKLQDELNTIQQELSSKHKNRIEYRDGSTQTDSSDNFINKLAADNEKRELENLVKELQSRIEELTLRSVRLSRQLEEAQLRNKQQLRSTETTAHSSKIHTILSESSSTDDIIQDAKQRLKRLEEESFRADQGYLNYVNTLTVGSL